MEKRKSVDQKRFAVRRFMRAYENVLRRQGVVVETWRDHQGRRLGPYYRLACRDSAGRQRSCYLGADASLANEVRLQLARLQAPHRARQHLVRQKKTLRRELRRQWSILTEELRRIGLERKGSEVRGWRRRGWALIKESPR